MSKYPGQLTRVESPKGITWEYWFGVFHGKRIYLVAPQGSLNTWEFASVEEVKAFIALH